MNNISHLFYEPLRYLYELHLNNLKAHGTAGLYYSLDIQTLQYQYKKLMRSLIFKIQLFIIGKILAPGSPYARLETQLLCHEEEAIRACAVAECSSNHK